IRKLLRASPTVAHRTSSCRLGLTLALQRWEPFRDGRGYLLNSASGTSPDNDRRGGVSTRVSTPIVLGIRIVVAASHPLGGREVTPCCDRGRGPPVRRIHEEKCSGTARAPYPMHPWLLKRRDRLWTAGFSASQSS